MAAFPLGLGQCLTHLEYINPPPFADSLVGAHGQQPLIQQDICTKGVAHIPTATHPQARFRWRSLPPGSSRRGRHLIQLLQWFLLSLFPTPVAPKLPHGSPLAAGTGSRSGSCRGGSGQGMHPPVPSRPW